MLIVIRRCGLILSFCLVVIIEACAGPSSASVGVGVGVGVPRPYPGPPSATIWIGRPTPRTLYDHVPAAQDRYFGQSEATYNSTLNLWPE